MIPHVEFWAGFSAGLIIAAYVLLVVFVSALGDSRRPLERCHRLVFGPGWVRWVVILAVIPITPLSLIMLIHWLLGAWNP